MTERLGVFTVNFRRVELRSLGELSAQRETVRDRLADRHRSGAIEEVVLLSTCNRFEVLFSAGDPEREGEALRAMLAELAPDAASAGACLTGEAALRHVLRVAASLESMLLGEGQILGQVRAAREQARTARTIGPRLELVIDQALAAAKAVRSRTSLGDGRLSVASLAARSIAQVAERVKEPVVALVGAGSMAHKAGLYLKSQGLARLLIVNRTRAHADALAAELGATAIGLAEFLAAPPRVDILISAVTSPAPIFGAREIAMLRAGRELLAIDLAVPGNVAADVGREDQGGALRVRRMDDLKAEAEQNRQRREQETTVAEEILAQKVAVVTRRLAERAVVPILRKVQEDVDVLQQSHVERLLQRELSHLSDLDKQLIRSFSESLARRCAESSMPLLRQLASAPKIASP